MLVQSDFDEKGNVIVKLLPALPEEKAWQSGTVRGLAIKGDWTIDFEWQNGKIVSQKLHPGKNAIPEQKITLIPSSQA